LRSLYASLYEAAFYRGYERLRHRTTWRWLDLLHESERWPRERLEAFQLAELQHLLAYAATASPYYRELLARPGLRPSEIRSLADLERIPPIDRETFRRESPRMLVPEHAGTAIWKSTGGSTGTPIRFALDRGSNDWRTAAMLRGYGWAGVREGLPTVHLWSGAVAGAKPVGRMGRLKKQAHHRLVRRLDLDIFALSEDTAPAYLEAMARFGARHLVSYGKHLYHLARMIERRGLEVPRLESIVLGAEKVTREEVAVIERVFGCPAFETYGCREVMLIATQCERRGALHVTMENLVVEVLREDGTRAAPGEVGEVVVTDLHNYAMPFIRYRTGDVARVGGPRDVCACGRAHATLSEVEGRIVDVLRTLDGRVVPGNFFPHLMKEFDAVARYQVYQPAVRRVEVSVVLDRALTQEEEARLRGEIERVLGPTVDVAIRQVESIPLSATGKHRVAISDVREADVERARREGEGALA
jgi:phenylacetate-CoA ligase